jgi:predicted ribosomally synthesized peptide with nif11-like leader
MSVESAKEFVKRVATDQAFGKQLLEQKTDEQRQKFAADAGYVFTEDDLQQLLPAGVTVQGLRDLEGKSELPDEMMEAIIGGKSQKEAMWAEIGITVGIDLVIQAAAAAI